MINKYKLLTASLIAFLFITVNCSTTEGTRTENFKRPEKTVKFNPTINFTYDSNQVQKNFETSKVANPESIEEVFQDALKALRRIDKDSKEKIEIKVKEASFRSTFTAVMFGAMAGGDTFIFDLIIRDEKGKEIDKINFTYKFYLGGLIYGSQNARKKWLNGEIEKNLDELF